MRKSVREEPGRGEGEGGGRGRECKRRVKQFCAQKNNSE